MKTKSSLLLALVIATSFAQKASAFEGGPVCNEISYGTATINLDNSLAYHILSLANASCLSSGYGGLSSYAAAKVTYTPGYGSEWVEGVSVNTTGQCVNYSSATSFPSTTFSLNTASVATGSQIMANISEIISIQASQGCATKYPGSEASYAIQITNVTATPGKLLNQLTANVVCNVCN